MTVVACEPLLYDVRRAAPLSKCSTRKARRCLQHEWCRPRARLGNRQRPSDEQLLYLAPWRVIADCYAPVAARIVIDNVASSTASCLRIQPAHQSLPASPPQRRRRSPVHSPSIPTLKPCQHPLGRLRYEIQAPEPGTRAGNTH